MNPKYSINHMSIDIEGVLNWPKKDFKRIARIFQNEDGTRATEQEVRNFLYSKLMEGYHVIPMNGKECEGWDKVNGCPGHEISEEDYKKRTNHVPTT